MTLPPQQWPNRFAGIGVVSPRAPGLGMPQFDNFVRAALRNSPEPGDTVPGEGSGSRAAPAAQEPRATAAAAARGPRDLDRFDVDYFLNYEERLGTSFKQHNQTLKWWRHLKEDLTAPFESEAKWFDNVGPTMVAVCDHGAGTSFGFKSDEEVPWRWQEMVATLREEDIKEVVGGPAAAGL